MPSTSRASPASAACIAFAFLASTATVAAQSLPPLTYKGCFSSSQPLKDQGSFTFQTSSHCQPICVGQKQTVLGLSGGSDCWCGDELPPTSQKVDDSNCNTPCNGYGAQKCGGTNFWTVYLTGLSDNVASFGGGSSSSSSSSSDSSSSTSSTSSKTDPPDTATTPAPSVVTSVGPGQTIVVTKPVAGLAESTSSPSSHSGGGGGSNVAGIASGVVVGVLAAGALVGGLFYWLHRRRKHAADEEYHRSTQVSDFMRGGERKPPATGYSQMSDSRLDPEVGNRRNSQGSIADDQDHSRRILRVANPDDS